MPKSPTSCCWLVGLVLLGAGSHLQAQQVYVEDSPAAAEVLAAVEDRLSKQEPDEAARLLQQVFDEHGQKLLELERGSYAEAARAAVRLAVRTPALLSSYRQLYEPLADRRLQDAAGDRGLLRAVTRRYPLTDSGLKAGLYLAGLSLEAGEADAAAIALTQLREHPALASQQALYRRLVAMAALLRGDRATFDRVHKELADAGEAAAAAELNRLAERIDREPAVPPLSPLDPLPPAAPPTVVSPPMWISPTGGAERFLIDHYRVEDNQLEGLAQSGRFLNPLPLVFEDTLYVNDGQAISALEPSSGRRIWRHEVVENDDRYRMTIRGGAFGRWLPYGVDMSVLGASGGRIVGIMGFGSMQRAYPYGYQNSPSLLVCVDAHTGERVWLRKPAEVDSRFNNGFWYGRPIVADGRVYVMVRRRERTQFRVAYVLAVDLDSGKLLWRRHLASTPIINYQAIPGMAHMALDGGYLYVDSRLGSVAKLSVTDGSVVWLTLVPVDEEQRAERDHRPWHASAPVAVSEGLVVLDDWGDKIRVFDQETGKVLRSIPAADWGSPTYLMPSGKDLLAVGKTVGRYSGDALEKMWSHDLGESLRGRAALAGDRLSLPGEKQVTVLDTVAGKPVRQFDIRLPANLLALDGQLIGADRRGLTSYSKWEVAEKQLRDRMKRRPQDPRPLMGYIWLAFNTGRQETLFASLDRAVAMLEESQDPSPLRDELFDQLLMMAEHPAQDSDQQFRRDLFERIASITDGPDQEVVYQLALARYHQANGELEEAVSSYQRILSEPAYRRRLYVHESGSRQAGLEAQRQLTALIKKHGREHYQRHDLFARQQLLELAAQADPDPLIELAEAYPLAEVTADALALAADRTAARGQQREAVGLLRRAAGLTEDPDRLGAIFGRQAELYLAAQQPLRARRVLRHLTAAHPDVQPLRDGRPVPAEAWLAELADLVSGSGGEGRINWPLSASPRVLPGRLLRPTRQDPDAAVSGSFLVQEPKRLVMYQSKDLSIRWQRPLSSAAGAADAPVELLSVDRNRVWLWLSPQRKLQLLDARTGEVRWEDDKIDQKLAAIKGLSQSRADAADKARPFVFNINGQGRVVIRGGRNIVVRGGAVVAQPAAPAALPDHLISVSDVVVAVADHNGRVIVFSADHGKVRWQSAAGLRRVSHIRTDGRHVVLAGIDGDSIPLVYVYDAQTGQLIHRLPKAKRQVVQWVGLSEEGLLIYVSPMQIEAFDLTRGQARWICEPQVHLMGGRTTWLGSGRLATRSREGDLLWVDLADGNVVGRLPVRDLVADPMRVEADGSRWFVSGSNRCLAVTDSGVPLWQDAMTDGGKVIDQRLTERYVLLLTRPAADDGLAPHRRRLYLLDRNGGAIRYQQSIEPGETFDSAHLLDGRLLLSGEASTAVLTGD